MNIEEILGELGQRPITLNFLAANETTTMSRIRIDKLTTFNYRTLTRIRFWNVMTFNDDDDQVQPNQKARILRLENKLLRYNLVILGVSEARWIGSETVKMPSGYTVFLYAGKDEGADKAAGIGFLMTPRAHCCLISWETISERLITA